MVTLVKKTFVLSKKRIILGVVFAVIAFFILLLVGSSTIGIIITTVAYLVIGFIKIKKPCSFWWSLLLLPGFSCLILRLSQLLLNQPFSALGLLKIMLGAAVCMILFSLLMLFTGKVFLSLCVGTIIILILSTANYYVCKFRGTDLTPSDILSIGTAANVAIHYSYSYSLTMVYAWLWAGLLLFGLTSFTFQPVRWFYPRLLAVALMIVGTVSLVVPGKSIPIHQFRNSGSMLNGFLLNFSKELGATVVLPPKTYSSDSIQALETQYASAIESSFSKTSPTIIVIMDESFADLSILGDNLHTNTDVIPFFSSLKNSNDTVFGYALSSVFGGQTANSEFEFLTGNSMAWLPQGSVAYQQYIHGDFYSIVSVLHDYGYDCTALHPYYEKGWNRPNVYSYFGFDDTLFLDDFVQEDLIRTFVSDKEMFSKVINLFENNSDHPQFSFGITMQNHGNYLYAGDDFHTTIELSGNMNHYPDAEQYLTIIHETDSAIKYLID